jgi:hypothetical protein
MLRANFLVFFTCFIALSANAGIKDSILYYVKNKYPAIIGGLSGRNTFIGSHYTSVTGAAIGASYGGKVKFLAGIYKLSKPINEVKTIYVFTPQEQKINEVSRFWYFGLNAGYVFFKKNHWTLDIPLRVGFGQATIEQYDLTKQENLITKNRSFIMPIESGIGVQYTLGWWIGIGAGLGSRIVVGKNTSQKFSGTYYNFGINIFFSDIYYHIRDDMKKNPVHNFKFKKLK